MLSYMVPSPNQDKPPTAPAVSNKNINISSADSSNSSLNSNSDVPSVQGSTNAMCLEKTKTKISNDNTKQTTLKRVSFGSSKGSMVETLIYETPVQEESETFQSHIQHSDNTYETESEGVKVPSNKVRVSFFESSDKKYIIESLDSSGNQINSDNFLLYESFIMSSPSSNNVTLHCSYERQESTDSGWDNPFRPDGDLSKEADEIVELIKEGKPITPTQASNPSKLLEENGSAIQQNVNSTTKANGNAPVENSLMTGVEVQHGTTAKLTDASQIEHVVIKKKSKCNCCVVL
ncbi:hypothetical protein PGB90_006282 [Kerria lacca]